jgi:glyoxylase-like metal-dependent hydrolase (beta-lactamase superfamily II)
MRKEYDIPVYALEKERALLEDPMMNVSAYYGPNVVVKDVTYLKDNDVLELAGCKIEVLATPGHTMGGCCYYIKEDNILFSGDTLFHASVGRSDFPTGNFDQMEQAIRERLFVLPDETVVYPGHMDTTTIQYEKAHNPFVRL